MNPEKDKEFDSNMNQLIWLLKKIIKALPSNGSFPQMPGSSNKDGSVNLNLCFFTFVPMAPEELDELEESYEQFFAGDDKFERGEEVPFELSPADLEFLRRNGIRY